ncbi:MAG: hypothetical protein ACRDMZ_14650 [Solirubrobacteraceae bacterium]
MTTSTQQNIAMGLVQSTAAGFVPRSAWPELEAAREAHERALEEHRSEQARRQHTRTEERQLQEHLAAVQQAKREARDSAKRACDKTVSDALAVVADRGAAWLEEIATARAEALNEHAELLARAAEAEARAHKDDALVAWILQVSSSSVPQPSGSLEPAAVAS